jgi:hypothetical protein
LKLDVFILWSFCTATVAGYCGAAPSVAADVDKYWDSQPYRIKVAIAIDALGQQGEQLGSVLPTYLMRRAESAIGPLWQLSVDQATGEPRHLLLNDIDAITSKQVSKPDAADKLVLLAVRATPWGYELAGREYDGYVDRWGATLRESARQNEVLPEALFALLRRVVTPLAQFHLDPSNDRQVILLPRGASLPHPSDDEPWATEGDIYLPVMRRTTRDGELVPGGVQVVPWTFLEIASVDPQQAVGRIESGSTRPFALRQRGRIEQVAIALRSDDGETVVRLRSRTQKDKPLVGYEVYSQNSGEHDTRLIGTSDSHGQLRVVPGKTAVQLLYIKSGGELLARVPMVPGFTEAIDIPLPDDDLRMEAAARVSAMREDLVDLVARRNIVMARVRKELEDKNYQQARKLLEMLDELPTRAQFTQNLEREQRLHRTKDPQVQRQIDQLFAGMQTTVGKFLDSQPIADLHEQLREAQQQKGS